MSDSQPDLPQPPAPEQTSAPERSEGPPKPSSAPSGGSEDTSVPSVGAGFAAGPPQGKTAPSGGSEDTSVPSVGAGFAAGPPQGKTAPSGGSEDTSVPSVGAGNFWLVPRKWALLVAVLAAAGLLVSGLLWQKLGNIQEELARRSLDSGAQAIEARTLARQAQE